MHISLNKMFVFFILNDIIEFYEHKGQIYLWFSTYSLIILPVIVYFQIESTLCSQWNPLRNEAI